MVVNVICALGGVAVGGAAVGLWVQHQKSEWVEAYGTWFGAVATVVAVLWAVQTFRSDQVHRQRQLDEETHAEAERAAEAEAGHLADASQIWVTLNGGGGYGSGEQTMMTTMHIRIGNNGLKPVTVSALEVGPPLALRTKLTLPIHIAPSTTWAAHVEVSPTNVDPSQLMDNPLVGHSARIEYTINTRRWERLNKGEPQPL